VAAAYVIVGWLLLQISDTLVPALHLPEWFHSGVAFLLIIGFPLALIFAWAFELTPDGLRKEKEVDKAQSISQTTGQKLNYVIIGLMAAALAYFAWDKFAADKPAESVLEPSLPAKEQVSTTEPASAQKPDEKSIAVIPFQNRSANKENAAFFSDGIHDELLTNLSRIHELKVISRTSVMNYRDTTKNLRQIGEELGVAKILEGGVQRAGDKVRINVQLIDAATDEHLWAEVYDRQLTAENVFAIQTEISRAIANALEATLSPREQAMIAKAPTANLEAYDSLMMASQLMDRGNWQSLRDAQSYLKKATALDPGFVRAHVLLAKTYFDLFNTGATTIEEVSDPWQKSLQTALSLDPENAGAIAIQALYLWSHGMEGVDEAFDRARQLDPHNAEIIIAYGMYLRKNFQPNRALALYEMARELDPVSIDVLSGLSRIQLAREEFDQALETFARIRQVDPASVQGYGPVTEVYLRTGDMAHAMEWLFKATLIDPEDSDLSNWIALLYLDFGDLDSARKWLLWIEQNHAPNPMNLSNWAMLHIYEGHLESAMDYARQLNLQTQDRWGSDAAMVRTLLIWALDQGQEASTLGIIKQAHPELFNQPPFINAGNVLQAIDTAQLLQNEDLNDEATALLQAAIAAYEKPYEVTDSSLVPAKAYALALLGEKQAALNELRHQVDKGWRLHWRWSMELNPNFVSLRNDPEFQAIVEFVRADINAQLPELRALEASSGVSPPMGDERQ
jgi:TolB-like protein/Flp pilus assembly protein TadD